MKLFFAISFIFAVAAFAILPEEVTAFNDIPKDEEKVTLNHVPKPADVIAITDIPVGEGKPRLYDPCYYNPPNAAGCGSLCTSYGYNGGLCISYACYCLLY